MSQQLRSIFQRVPRGNPNVAKLVHAALSQQPPCDHFFDHIMPDGGGVFMLRREDSGPIYVSFEIEVMPLRRCLDYVMNTSYLVSGS